MYNTDMPTRAELPTSAQLLRSTILALIAAAVILVTMVLPAEYGIDPTGIGRAIGLAEMGDIKVQLAKEAEADRLLDRQRAPAGKSSNLLGKVLALFWIQPAAAHAGGHDQDVTSVTLKPGQGAEVKLEMKKGDKAKFSWIASGPVNFDLHGDAGGKETSYKKGRGATGDEGILEAGFDGLHGWFWRNRNSQEVIITLTTEGDYTAIKRMQ